MKLYRVTWKDLQDRKMCILYRVVCLRTYAWKRPVGHLPTYKHCSSVQREDWIKRKGEE